MVVEDVVFQLGIAGETLSPASPNEWVYSEAAKMP